MDWINVESSNIDAIAYEDGVLHVWFKGGNHYTYDGVTEETFNQFLNSTSKGRFFHTHIRGHYSYERKT